MIPRQRVSGITAFLIACVLQKIVHSRDVLVLFRSYDENPPTSNVSFMGCGDDCHMREETCKTVSSLGSRAMVHPNAC